MKTVNINPLFQKNIDDFGVHAKDASLRTSSFGGGGSVAITRMIQNYKNLRKQQAACGGSMNSGRVKNIVKKSTPSIDRSGYRDSTNIFSGQRVPEQYK